ncbi:hypothetical protein SteCoe_10949 [Stentor coeruleus]|uniref:MIF4G domain-containing protein n=1 Tax=Stentor coeruleus TaxID=5963 RepID=A0A1R2CEA5_9CILI|nr:hypothetical protein SteCoe_10949 [Stentor coeruleus]
MSRISYKQVPRISSAPPDEGEPDLKYNPSFNLNAAEFRPGIPLNPKPNVIQKPMGKGELRANASSYEPAKPKPLSFDAPIFEFKSSALEFVPLSFPSPGLSESTPTFVPSPISTLNEPIKDLSQVEDFIMEPIKPDVQKSEELLPIEILESEVVKGQEKIIEENKVEEIKGENEDIVEDIGKNEDKVEDVWKNENRIEDIRKNELSEVKEVNEALPEELEKGDKILDAYDDRFKEEDEEEEDKKQETLEVVPEEPKKRVYDFDDIKNLKLMFFKDPNFFIVPPPIIEMKERVVEVIKTFRGGKRQGEERKIKETVCRITWRKAKTAEEQKISDRAKEYVRRFTVTVAEQEAIKKKVRVTLNKLSPNNLEKLSNEILETCKKSHDYLKLVVSGIFEKAWSETKYTQMYSSICKFLKANFEDYKYPDIDPVGVLNSKNYFKYELLYMCEETFKKNPEENDLATLPEEKKQEVLVKLKKKTLGNVRFIGELYNVNLITANIILECITSLLDLFEKDINEDKLEGACVLLLTGAGSLERPKLKPSTDIIYLRLKRILENFNISTKNKFKIIDLQEHRESGWKTLAKEELKKVEEIHADFHNEQNVILKRHGYN